MTKRIIVLEFRQLIILFSNINFLAAIYRIRIRLHTYTRIMAPLVYVKELALPFPQI